MSIEAPLAIDRFSSRPIIVPVHCPVVVPSSVFNRIRGEIVFL